jgi:hypothetical protein
MRPSLQRGAFLLQVQKSARRTRVYLVGGVNSVYRWPSRNRFKKCETVHPVNLISLVPAEWHEAPAARIPKDVDHSNPLWGSQLISLARPSPSHAHVSYLAQTCCRLSVILNSAPCARKGNDRASSWFSCSGRCGSGPARFTSKRPSPHSP